MLNVSTRRFYRERYVQATHYKFWQRYAECARNWDGSITGWGDSDDDGWFHNATVRIETDNWRPGSYCIQCQVEIVNPDHAEQHQQLHDAFALPNPHDEAIYLLYCRACGFWKLGETGYERLLATCGNRVSRLDGHGGRCKGRLGEDAQLLYVWRHEGRITEARLQRHLSERYERADRREESPYLEWISDEEAREVGGIMELQSVVFGNGTWELW